MHVDQILLAATERDASDIHLIVGQPPLARIHTLMEPLEGFPVISTEEGRQMLEQIACPQTLQRLQDHRDADFSYHLTGVGRFRVNAHFQRGGIGIAMRAIKNNVPPLMDLALPEVVNRLVHLPRGLILVTGNTGSGKSTTLASMIHEMNGLYGHHVITLEDPIEYELTSERCVIEQREVGPDVASFASGLRHALRQDPDVILVGEMRDLETTSAAITAAETGHLVLSTLHTVSAARTVDRIIDMYPAAQQGQIRTMLASTIQAIIGQTLIKRIDRPGMVPAVEILLATPAVRNLIRENRTFEIRNVIETSRAMDMTTLDHSLAQLYFNGVISRDDAISQALYPEQLERSIGM